jgi:peptide/nickel transport system substrate-binding protein
MNKKAKLFWLFLVCALVLAFVIGCDTDEEVVDEKKVEEPVETTFIVARSTDANTLDCGYAYYEGEIDMMYHLYEGLVRFKDETLAVEPALALNWSVSDDGLIWTFELREGVKFHDGTDFNAEAVEFSFMRILDEEHPYYGLGDQGLAYMDWLLAPAIKDVRAVGDYTVEIELNDVFGPFLTYMGVYSQYIVSPTAVETHGEEYYRNPSGTGPFKFLEWRRDEYVKMAAFDGYWGEKPAIEEVVWKVVPDESTRLMELMAGDVHAIKSIAPAQLATIQGNPDLKLLQVAGSNLFFAAINHEAEPFDDVRVRQALMHAIDFDSMVDSLYEGLGTRAVTSIPPTIPGFNRDIKPYAYDPEKAKDLLTEAGYPDGFSMKLHTFTEARGYISTPVDAAEIMKSDLAKVGIDVEIVANEWGTHRPILREHEHQLGLIGWFDIPCPNSFLNLLLQGAANTRYRPSELKELAGKALSTYDRAEQEAYYKEIQWIAHEDVALMNIAHSDYSAVVLSRISGFELDSLGNVLMHNVRFQ